MTLHGLCGLAGSIGGPHLIPQFLMGVVVLTRWAHVGCARTVPANLSSSRPKQQSTIVCRQGAQSFPYMKFFLICRVSEIIIERVLFAFKYRAHVLSISCKMVDLDTANRLTSSTTDLIQCIHNEFKPLHEDIVAHSLSDER